MNTAQQEQLKTSSEASSGEGSAQLPQHPAKQKGWHLLDAPTRRRTFYKYERRIRDFSQPDKVFHYFSSRTQPDGSRWESTCCDCMHSVTEAFAFQT